MLAARGLILSDASPNAKGNKSFQEEGLFYGIAHVRCLLVLQPRCLSRNGIDVAVLKKRLIARSIDLFICLYLETLGAFVINLFDFVLVLQPTFSIDYILLDHIDLVHQLNHLLVVLASIHDFEMSVVLQYLVKVAFFWILHHDGPLIFFGNSTILRRA
jgi:hypothetical protein